MDCCIQCCIPELFKNNKMYSREGDAHKKYTQELHTFGYADL